MPTFTQVRCLAISKISQGRKDAVIAMVSHSAQVFSIASVRRKQLDLFEQEIDEMALRIDPQRHRDAQQQIPDIAVQQANDPQTKQDEEHPLQDLECTNDDQPAVVTTPNL